MARVLRSPILLICILGLAFLLGRGVSEAFAADLDPAPADSNSTVKSPAGYSWLEHLFDRYVRISPGPGEDLRGKARETISRYEPYAGWTIAVVLVNQVDTFDEDWAAHGNIGTRIFNRLSNPLRCCTKDGTVRRQLLFRRGQVLDPFALADSELLLRSLRFIDDVRITVIPLAGVDREVAVAVETRDHWPLGANAKVFGQDRFDASVYSVNLFGWGLAWSHELIRNADREPGWGYRSHIRQPNLTGHFVDLDLDFEDSWRRFRRAISLEKKLVHPGVRLVGGGELVAEDDRENNQIPRKFTVGDYWLGRVWRVGAGVPGETTSRLLLVPALGYHKVSFSKRPAVSLTENRSFHDRKLMLAGLSLLSVRDYKTNYFYRMGETEDIRSGWIARVSVGYDDGEFQKRSGAWLQTGMVAVGRHGQVTALGLGGGGYWRSGDFEEGVLDATGFFATGLYGLGAYGQRWYLRAHYTRGFDRFPEEFISLGNRTGLRGLDDDVLVGRQRLVTSLESRLFTPWSLLGFRYQLLAYVDAGVIADQNASLFRRRISLSSGVGIRLDNPGLILPPVLIRVGVLDRAQGLSTVVELSFGKRRLQEEFLFPVVKPEPVAFK